jgi:acetoin:2,6-dichlorophenolindophenol oxidoreductase subunit alpha
VVMPGAKVSGISALALRCGVPGIAVDGNDAVAIYRVSQESIGRARTGDGAAVMECIPFVVAGMKHKRGEDPHDAVAGMERYMLPRKVVTPAWMEREARTFAQLIAAEKARA